jgi:hypothetical protein
VFDMTTGQDQRLNDGDKMWTPVGVDDSAAYAMSSDTGGLWQFPFTGAPRKKVASGGGYWAVISAGAAWGFATRSVPDGASTVLRRLDLQTGLANDFASVTTQVTIIGLDGAGLPVLGPDQGGSIFVLSESGDATLIASNFLLAAGQKNYSPGSPYRVVGDTHGLWLGGADGVYLYQNGDLGKVSSILATPAGGCG